jgi:hypothetical protein
MSKLLTLEDSETGATSTVRVRQRSDEKTFLAVLQFSFGKRPSVIEVHDGKGNIDLVPPIPNALFPRVHPPPYRYILRFQDEMTAARMLVVVVVVITLMKSAVSYQY